MDSLLLPRLMVSAPHKSSGKTTVTLGIAAYFAAAGERVSCFKKGPDYIDPMWHRLASGRESRNLDPWLMGPGGCMDSFVVGSRGGTLSLIEGNHGLHDGMSLDGSDSSAGLALMLQTPVLLVIDSRKMNRAAAAIVMGMQAMQPKVTIAGVILNQVRSPRHAEKQKLAIETFCRVPVVGAIPAESRLVIAERHLGLTTVGETAGAAAFIRDAAELVALYCDMQAIRSLFGSAQPLVFDGYSPALPLTLPEKRVRIGVFRDAAFCFYYPENLRALEEHGAELLFIDSMQDRSLPDVDGLYLGGGFPESFFPGLSANRSLMREVKERVDADMPLYAECGGLIWLSRSGTYGGKTVSLAGILPFDIGFQSLPAGHGYLRMRSCSESPWFEKGVETKAHEFHYSTPTDGAAGCRWQFDLMRGQGVTGRHDGVLYRNLFASYAHLHAVGNPLWAKRFTDLCAAWKKGR
ncbi:cobyrinate a,c-diamide synthase [Chlorobium sp.]|uniref:cobyrinate a,c-diamide synthase n=1 Tax=Chlorobium sp. TaxID=1095 RepID=UPI003C4D62E4|nr:cobyrinate a,c-diamide synthase [Chlorobiaceae bacterium]